MPSYTVTGLVIHRTNLGETDKILTLFTRERGKISAVAKGVRRPGSKMSGVSELFTDTRFLLSTGRTLEIINQAEILDSFPALRNELNSLARATYLCELLDRMTLDQDTAQSGELHDLIVSALHILGGSPPYPDAVVHALELQLLASLGYAPQLDTCARCGSSLTPVHLGFSPSAGGALCATDRHRVDDAFPVLSETLKLLHHLQSADAQDLTLEPPSEAVRADAARAMRWYVRYRAERDIRSADFLDQIRAAS